MDKNKTIEFIKDKKFIASKKMGQNFLINPQIQRKIVESANLEQDDLVVEIGPGLGAITEQILKNSNNLLAIELDKRLFEELSNKFKNYNNFKIINNDVLKIDLKQTIQKEFKDLKFKRIIVIANLPYSISSLIVNYLIESKIVSKAIIMVQKEMAQRLVAKTNSKDYNSFSSWVSLTTKVKFLFDVSNKNFIPEPNVLSSVIELEFNNEYENTELNNYKKFFFECFKSRRKTILNNLLNIFSKQKIMDALETLNFNQNTRAQELNSDELIKLYKYLNDYKKEQKTMQYKSYYKINLGLNVLDLDKNSNKHNLESIIIKCIDRYDLVTIEESNKNIIKYFDKDNKEIIIENCLLNKVIDYLKVKFKLTKKYKIEIIKNIKMNSGLGSASSNAAILIHHILNDLNLSVQDLDMYEITKELGSDIPFFLSNYSQALVSGIGDKVEKINLDLSYLDIEILENKTVSSTKKIFDNYTKLNKIHILNDYKDIISKIQNKQRFVLFNNLLDSYLLEFNEKNMFNIIKSTNDIAILNGAGSNKLLINFKTKIRTRYAPSPTGFFHIGGARTALFNYLYARHMNGEFILRIEDTDSERNQEGGIESQYNNLLWLGMDMDESLYNPNKHYGEYLQSKKIDKYYELAKNLVEQDKAYYCFCTKEELESQREQSLHNHETPKYKRTCLRLTKEEIEEKLAQNIPHAIRLKIQNNITFEWDDLIRGKIEVPSNSLTDPIIIKANKTAMYNFAVVVDDYDMKITHVLRGEEHISNTPYQLAIANALYKNNKIKYGHLSIIVDETGKKLSKRNQDLKQFIEDYKNLGFLPEAIFNFLSLLSWNNKNNKEIMSKEEIIKNFSIDSLSKSPSYFDEKKLLWISNEHFKNLEENKYLEFVKPFVDKQIISSIDKELLDDVLLLFKPQIHYATELNKLISEYLLDFKVSSLTHEEKQIILENKKLIKYFKKLIKRSWHFSVESISEIINKTKDKFGIKGKELFMPIRIAVTLKSHGPELAKIIFLINKKQVIENLNNSLELI